MVSKYRCQQDFCQSVPWSVSNAENLKLTELLASVAICKSNVKCVL
uniref:Uncharacterized protein n=1 Tax=Escherichia coli TaxID=562 RepID=A0A7D7PQC9_ECOLX|nr:hypothetical protein [Escherichia coli]